MKSPRSGFAALCLAVMIAAVGCRQGVGERCQVQSDCESGLECTGPDRQNSVCTDPNRGNTGDGGQTDGAPDAFLPADGLPSEAVDGNADISIDVAPDQPSATDAPGGDAGGASDDAAPTD